MDKATLATIAGIMGLAFTAFCVWLAVLVIFGGILAAVIVIAACAGILWLRPRLTS